jgi:hypothetical protein
VSGSVKWVLSREDSGRDFRDERIWVSGHYRMKTLVGRAVYRMILTVG